ncbi:Hypothetical protein CINCED_3A002848 [Cinara cedri]|uniref:Uncharacterized protein n=1 Tax=Cinara cedri TaxID=506608 RepID=A0A5E4M818_9HEMI|nr:Hypothetical protein CINCED_3A002848 [Cinara cedri]
MVLYRTRIIIIVLVQILVIFIRESACINNRRALRLASMSAIRRTMTDNAKNMRMMTLRRPETALFGMKLSPPRRIKSQSEVDLEIAISMHYEHTETSNNNIDNVGSIDKMTNVLLKPMDALETFQHILNRIVQLLYNSYTSIFADIILISFVLSRNENDNHRVQFKTEYLDIVCSYIPRILDYLYISHIPKNIEYFYLNKFHCTLCYRMLNFVKKNCTATDSGYMICTTRKVQEIYSNILSYLNRDDFPKESNYHEIDKMFIKSAYEHISKIDRTLIIDYAHVEFNIFKDVNKRFHNAIIQTADPKAISEIDDQLLKDIVNNFLRINTEYINELMLNTCDLVLDLSEEDVKDLSTPTVVSKLLLYTFRRLEKQFKDKVDEFQAKYGKNVLTRVNEKRINNDVLHVFKGLCDYTPKILLYLAERRVNIGSLSSLYLSFCGNLMDFIDSRCPRVFSNGNVEKNYTVRCVTESIKDKLMWNLYTITKIISKRDQYTSVLCTNVHNKYIENIHAALIDFRYQEIGLWPMYNWLSGKYFFTEDYDNSSFNQIKENIIYINGIPFTLSEIYYQFLPLNTKLETVFAFHNIILDNLDAIMNTYVYRYAFTIVLYLKHMNNKVDKQRLLILDGSTIWYETGKSKLYKYLRDLPVPYKSPENIGNMVSNIKCISDTITNGYSATQSIQENIPPKILKETREWAEPQLVGKTGTDYLNRLNEILIDNCLNAMEIASIFVNIAVKSDVIKINVFSEQFSFTTDELFCAEHLSKIYSTS